MQLVAFLRPQQQQTGVEDILLTSAPNVFDEPEQAAAGGCRPTRLSPSAKVVVEHDRRRKKRRNAQRSTCDLYHFFIQFTRRIGVRRGPPRATSDA